MTFVLDFVLLLLPLTAKGTLPPNSQKCYVYHRKTPAVIYLRTCLRSRTRRWALCWVSPERIGTAQVVLLSVAEGIRKSPDLYKGLSESSRRWVFLIKLPCSYKYGNTRNKRNKNQSIE